VVRHAAPWRARPRGLDLPATAFPLLFVGASTAFMLLAVPAGRLADRVGRGRAFVLGYVALLPVYVSLVLPAGGAVALAGCLTLVGASYAAADGVLAALGAATLGETVRASGLAVIGTATNAARLLASIAFGAVWTLAGLQTAVLAAAAGLAVTLAVTAVVLARTREVLAGG
jgi:MFS family permease